MTPFSKTVVRRTEQPWSRGKRLIVSLEPGDIIGVREERSKQKFNVPAKAIWDLAVKIGAQ